MRRTALVAIAVSLVILGSAIPASADPSPTPSVVVPSAVPGQNVCSVDTTLSGLTGLVTTANGYAVVNGGAPGVTSRLYLLDGACKRKTAISYPTAALDPEDLQVDANGNYWVSDSGLSSGGAARPRIAVWKISADGKGTIYRFTFPENKTIETEAMVLSGSGMPVFITRNASGAASVYTPSAGLEGATNNRAVALKLVGQFTPQHTGTSNKLGKAAELPITGGATSPDGTKVALRTFSDAYEWDVTNGDVGAAITTGTPRITPLPMEDEGSAIAYTRDGKNFVTLSLNTSGHFVIMKYTPSVPPAATNTSTAAKPKSDTRSWFSKLSLQQITYLVGAVGVLGLLMVIGGIIGIRQARKRRPAASEADPTDEPWDDDQDGAARGMAEEGTRGYDDGYDAYPDDRYPPQSAEPYEQPRYGGGGGTYGRPARRDDEYGHPARRDDGYDRPAPPAYQQPPARGGQAPSRGTAQPPVRGGQAPVRGGGQAAVPPRGGYPAPPRGYQQPPEGGSGRARRPETSQGWGDPSRDPEAYPDDYRDYRGRR